MGAEVNLVLAFGVFLLATIACLRWRHTTVSSVVLCLAFVSLAIVNVITASPAIPGVSFEIDALRFAAAFFRGVTVVLLIGYVWHRVQQQ